MSFCSATEKDHAWRRVHREISKQHDAEIWFTQDQLMIAVSQQDSISVEQLLLKLAVLTNATWYFEKAGAVSVTQ